MIAVSPNNRTRIEPAASATSKWEGSRRLLAIGLLIHVEDSVFYDTKLLTTNQQNHRLEVNLAFAGFNITTNISRYNNYLLIFLQD